VRLLVTLPTADEDVFHKLKAVSITIGFACQMYALFEEEWTTSAADKVSTCTVGGDEDDLRVGDGQDADLEYAMAGSANLVGQQLSSTSFLPRGR
jgi:hypothetical protein